MSFRTILQRSLVLVTVASLCTASAAFALGPKPAGLNFKVQEPPKGAPAQVAYATGDSSTVIDNAGEAYTRSTPPQSYVSKSGARLTLLLNGYLSAPNGVLHGRVNPNIGGPPVISADGLTVITSAGIAFNKEGDKYVSTDRKATITLDGRGYWVDAAGKTYDLPGGKSSKHTVPGGYPSTPPDLAGRGPYGTMSVDGGVFTTAQGHVYKRAGIGKKAYYPDGNLSMIPFVQKEDGTMWDRRGTVIGWAPVFVHRPEQGTYRILANGWILLPDGRITEGNGTFSPAAHHVATLTNGHIFEPGGAQMPNEWQADFAKIAAFSTAEPGPLPAKLSADGKSITDFFGVVLKKDPASYDVFLAPDGQRVRKAVDGSLFGESNHQTYGKL